ncbi:MAG: histidine triad nucleotide-binding protein [Gammaproteobacteria bacterium]|nr:histidine triad nucleotide-binding protein [Gammaproteobacteria bacterium]
MANCLFCKIIDGEIPATLVYEDDTVIALNDINPQAPTHILIVPRQHIDTLNHLTEADTFIVGHMVQVGQKLANQLGHAAKGYRLVMNCNADGGQTVFHIHLHLFAGRQFAWPPG